MTVTGTTISESALRDLLREATEESMSATVRFCLARVRDTDTSGEGAARHDEAVAWIAARVVQRAWDLLPGREFTALAPITWAVAEMVEWADHLVRLEVAGDREYRVPLTWLPRGRHPLGTRDVSAAVEERLALLRHELGDYGVVVTPRLGEEVAA